MSQPSHWFVAGLITYVICLYGLLGWMACDLFDLLNKPPKGRTGGTP